MHRKLEHLEKFQRREDPLELKHLEKCSVHIRCTTTETLRKNVQRTEDALQTGTLKECSVHIRCTTTETLRKTLVIKKKKKLQEF